MKRSICAVALAAAAVFPASALASPAQTVTPEAPVAKFRGPAQLGANVSYFGEVAAPGSCSTSPETYCDTTLVKVEGDFLGNKALTVRLDGFTYSDYDLRVYKSNAQGARLSFNGNPAGDGGGPVGSVLATGPGDFETSNVAGVKKATFYLVDVVYFATVPTETPQITVTLK